MKSINLKTKTTKELNKLKADHIQNIIKSKSIAASRKIHIKADLVIEMSDTVDFKELDKEYCKQGLIKTYIETGVVLDKNKDFYKSLDITKLANFYEAKTGEKGSAMHYINEYHKRYALHNDMNPHGNIYNSFQEDIDERMKNGECFTNIICMMELSGRAKEISETYNEMKGYSERVIFHVNEQLKENKSEEG